MLKKIGFTSSNSDWLSKKYKVFFYDISSNFFLFIPLFFSLGIIFFVKNNYQFNQNLTLILSLFFSCLALILLVWKEKKFFIIAASLTILSGSLYGFFYQNFSSTKESKITTKSFIHTGKIYIDGIGKISEIKQFSNAKNNSNGVSLIISKPEIYRAEFSKEKNIATKIATKKNQKKQNNKKKEAEKSLKVDANFSLEKNTKIYFDQLSAKIIKKKEQEKKKLAKEKILTKNQNSKLQNSSKNQKNSSKKKLLDNKRYLANFHNIKNYLEIDRKFLDLKNNYQHVDWIKKDEKSVFPYQLNNLSLTISKNNNNISAGDLIAFKAFLEPKDCKNFVDDFDYSLINKIKKIDASGFLIGEAKIIKKNEIKNIESFFSFNRKKIEEKIFRHLKNDQAAIAISLINGNQDYISPQTLEKIRLSGLSHLLSISGFHLSLAAAIFFVSIRFLLSRSQYLALNYDLKKIAAITSIIASFCYLKIADSPISAQRAFLVIMFFLISLLLEEKIHPKRILMIAALILMVLNPYQIFNISFQLSFFAVLVLLNFVKKNSVEKENKLKRFFNYFLEIVKISIIIQFFTAPFLLNSFQNFALTSFVANIAAIPLTSFIIMPLEFISLFLMPLSIEGVVIKLLNLPISWLISIAEITLKIPYSNIKTAFLPDFAVLIAAVGGMIFLLLESKFRYAGMVIFLSSFLLMKAVEKPDLIISPDQNFIAFFENDKLIFSNNYQANKMQKKLMEKFNQNEFITLKGNKNSHFKCDEENCYFEDKDKKIKILLIKKRQKIFEICQKDFNLLVNFSKKYQLPNCENKNYGSIDNIDFFNRGGHYLYFNSGEISIKSAN
jgi:ComEC/Rec2-related protein